MDDPRLATLLLYVAANVRRLRQTRDLTQDQLAEAAGLDLRFVQKVESGKSNLSLGALAAIADALTVSPSALLRKAVLPEVKQGRPKKPRAT